MAYLGTDPKHIVISNVERQNLGMWMSKPALIRAFVAATRGAA